MTRSAIRAAVERSRLSGADGQPKIGDAPQGSAGRLHAERVRVRCGFLPLLPSQTSRAQCRHVQTDAQAEAGHVSFHHGGGGADGQGSLQAGAMIARGASNFPSQLPLSFRIGGRGSGSALQSSCNPSVRNIVSWPYDGSRQARQAKGTGRMHHLVRRRAMPPALSFACCGVVASGRGPA